MVLRNSKATRREICLRLTQRGRLELYDNSALQFLRTADGLRPGRDGKGVPRVLACFMEALLDCKAMQLVDGGHAKRTITSIHDAIDALFLIIGNPGAAQNQIFNIGNARNEVSIAELALLMREIFADVTGDARVKLHPIENVSSLEFYGAGYEDCDRRVPDMTKTSRLLGWSPTRSLQQTLREAITYYYQEYGRRNVPVAV